ncbi:unnamed protein product [Caenorhabditis angaria]|uniref:Uncharacterized protein n=1 Tax=Caenorhabditis angaria TaxID=860376 RepID=A0A9P1MW18_9PELO|nr:unnamed protein product [Caenorhabditis angaria]
MSEVQESGKYQQYSMKSDSDFYTNYMTMKGRSKRSTRDERGLYSVRTCSLYMQADESTNFNGMNFGSDNPFCEDNVDVSSFLNLNSQRNHSAFCLAYALTFRDFVGGTLGLAWVASPQFNTAGGICQVHQRYNEGSRGWFHRSLNTGIVTLVNYGNPQFKSLHPNQFHRYFVYTHLFHSQLLIIVGLKNRNYGEIFVDF